MHAVADQNSKGVRFIYRQRIDEPDPLIFLMLAVVTLTADRGAGSGDHAAKLNVSASGFEVAHAVVYTFIK